MSEAESIFGLRSDEEHFRAAVLKVFAGCPAELVGSDGVPVMYI